MDDAELVARAVAGEPSAFAAIYDRYAERIHTYVWTLLHDPDEASDVTSETFVGAMSRIHQLRDPSALRPWLYAIARHEAFRRSKARARHKLTDAAIELPPVEPDVELDAEAVASLVWDAAAGLNPRDRDVLELHYRHGLAGEELAAALGTSLDQSYVVVSRLRDQLERTVGAYVVARQGRRDCDELANLLRDWDGTFSPLWRKRVARHVDVCSTCTRRRKAALAPESIAGASPFTPPAAALRDAVLAQIAGLNGATAGSWSPDRNGFPHSPRRRRWWLVLVTCAVVAGASATAVGVLANDDDVTVTTSDSGQPATTTTATSTTTSSTSTTTSTTSTTTSTTTTTTPRTTTTRPPTTTLPEVTFGSVTLTPTEVIEAFPTTTCQYVPNSPTTSTITVIMNDTTQVVSGQAVITGPVTTQTVVLTSTRPGYWVGTTTPFTSGELLTATASLPMSITMTLANGTTVATKTTLGLRNCI